MTINEYQKETLRTEACGCPYYTNNIGKARLQSGHIEGYVEGRIGRAGRLINGLMGLNGEAGEAIDILKKHLFQGHELDREHLAKELGDVAWYLAVTADALGYTLEEILEMNVEKLRARYPDGFDPRKSVNRKAGDL